MKFHNPWLDPRVTQLRPENATAYLRRRGWSLPGPAENPLFLLFQGPDHGPDAPTVLVPLQVDQGALLQRLIEVVGDVALTEDRWAVDVLNDMLRQPADAAPTNGPAVSARTEPAPK